MKKLQGLRAFRAAHGGNVAVTFTLALIPMMGAVGAAVDYSRGNQTKAALQASLDSAVLAAGNAISHSLADRVVIGQKQFSANFPLPDAPVPAITIKDKIIEATASYPMNTMFLGVLGVSHMDITGTAHALVEATPICLLLLEPSQNALYGNSGSRLTAPNCGIRANSTSNEAMFVNSGSKVDAQATCIVGKYKENSGGDIAPNPAVNCAPFSDPLAGLPEPPNATNPCQYTDMTVNNGESKVLSPGVYCTKLTINSGATVTLQSGNYIFKNAEVVINSGSKLVGDKVMLFFSGKDGRLNVNSQSTIQINAPVSGTYQGILMYQSRNKITLETNPFIVNSDGNSFFEGTIYLPNGKITMNSHSQTNKSASYTRIIARQMELNSHSKFHINSNYAGKTPLPAALSAMQMVMLLRLAQ